MMSLWDALRMNMMISYQELVRTFPNVPFSEMKPFTYGLSKAGILLRLDNSSNSLKGFNLPIVNPAAKEAPAMSNPLLPIIWS